jgi:thymidylate synthase
MNDSERYIATDSLSLAWLYAVKQLYDTPGGKAVHLILRISDPIREDPEIHLAAQGLIDDWNERHAYPQHKYDVLSTRNTIFPATWASRLPEPAELASYYRARYARLRKHDSSNKFGTYFGRFVAYPRETKHDHTYDQLTELVRKLREEVKSERPKSSRYEVNVFSERYDTNTMSFPCLAHLSFHLHEGRLHQQAVYRNEYLIGRAYGNYLGLAELQGYIASACDLDVGEFLVTVGHVELDGRRRAVAEMLDRFGSTSGSKN